MRGVEQSGKRRRESVKPEEKRRFKESYRGTPQRKASERSREKMQKPQEGRLHEINCNETQIVTPHKFALASVTKL